MSDKLFFKGRQDARQSHIKYGYKPNANAKLGSKKHPLNLVVTSEERLLKVQSLVDEAELVANITLDQNTGASESINELTVVLEKKTTVKKDTLPGRNDPCSCGSEKKYKKCCG